MKSRCSVGSLLLLLLLLLLICSAAVLGGAITGTSLAAADGDAPCCPVSNESGLQLARKHKHHHLLLSTRKASGSSRGGVGFSTVYLNPHVLHLMGGLKSIAAVVLIKIKIILVLAALVAVVVFTVKYLLGSGLLDKGFVGPPQLPPPTHAYQPIAHESLYGYGYQTPIPWEQMDHESQFSEWSKVGDGGRSLQPNIERTLLQNSFKHRRKRKRNINIINMYSYV